MSKTTKFLALLATLLLTLGMMPGGASVVFAADLCVHPTGDGGCYTTVQAAIAAASPGDTINIAAGTYSEPQLSINKNLTLQGSGVNDVIIQRSGGSSYFINVTGSIDSLTLKDLTVDAAGSATTNFVAHISGVTNVVLENVHLIGQGKDYTTDENPYYYNNPSDTNVVGGLDLINIGSASLKNVAVQDNARNCFGFSNVNTISLEDVSGENCGHSNSTGWAGIALYRTDGGTSVLSLAGDNSIDNAQIGLNVTIVSGSVTLPATGNLEITNSDIPLVLPKNSNSDTFAEMVAGAPFKVYTTAGTVAAYFDNETDAIAAALAGKAFFSVEHFVFDLDEDEFIVVSGMSIQAAINAASPGDTVSVTAGVYDEDVNVNKSLSLLGAAADSTTIRGVIGGDSATVRVSASDVTIAGFTITRIGNNTTDWNNAGLNSAGIAVQGTSYTGMVVRENILTGNRTAIDINNSSGHTITNNVITFNRTGLIFRNVTDNLTVLDNEITDNWTVGILFLDASSGTNTPLQTALNSTFSLNNISGNWYGQVVDRQTGGSLPLPGTTNLKNFIGNWWGSTTPVVSTLNSTEPGYAAQIPVAYGGTAEAPVDAMPDILGEASANIIYIPLCADENCIGPVHNTTQDTRYFTIQSAVDAANDGDTINVAAGTYEESVYVYKNDLTLLGPNAGLDPNVDTRVAEAIIQPTTWYGIYIKSSGVTLDGFTLDGQDTCQYGIYMYTTTGADEGADELLVTNNIIKDITTMGFIGWVQSGPVSSQNLVSHNLFEGIPGRAVVALWNYYANVTDNVIRETGVGIYAENANQPEATGTVVWSDNTISTSRSGIWYNLAYNTATPLTISGNTLTAEDDPAGLRWDAFWLTSLGGSLNPAIFDNTIIGSSITQTTSGYHMWNNTTSAVGGITVQGGSVTDVDYGVWINNFEGYPTTTGSNGGNTVATIDQFTITNAAVAGIYLHDNPSNTNGATVYADIQNSVITDSVIGILLDGEDASAKANNNQIYDNDAGVENNSGNLMSSICNWWGAELPYAVAELISGNVRFLPFSTVASPLNCLGVGQVADYDGDKKSDPAKFYPSNGTLWWLASLTSSWENTWLGNDTYDLVSGSDYDGDGKTDPAKFVSSETLWYMGSMTGLWQGVYLGDDGAVVGRSDFDGDEKTDPAKFVSSIGALWYIESSSGLLQGVYLGPDNFEYLAGNDFDGDGKSDPAKYVPSVGVLWYYRSTDSTWQGAYLGVGDYEYISGNDYDGDGKSDPTIFYASTGTVWWQNSSTETWDGVWMGPGTFDFIGAHDFDGDGKTDLAKFDPATGILSWLSSSDASWYMFDLGTDGYDLAN